MKLSKKDIINNLGMIIEKLDKSKTSLDEHYYDLPDKVWREKEEQVKALWEILERRTR